MSLGLYLHIPYCFSKCRYCDFYSAPGQRGVPRAYVDALLRELSRFAPDAPLRPDTLYFGGGTPSLLDPADAARLIAAAQPLPGAEITLEANPETVTEDSLRAFREAGVNRISFGVQSARDSQLKTLGRPHTARQARAAFAAARRAVRCWHHFHKQWDILYSVINIAGSYALASKRVNAQGFLRICQRFREEILPHQELLLYQRRFHQ